MKIVVDANIVFSAILNQKAPIGKNQLILFLHSTPLLLPSN